MSLSPEHRNTQTDRDTKPIIHRSYQGDTRQYRFNVYSCKAHIIDSRRARVAAFIGRQKERARQHAAATHGRQGQSRVYSSTISLSQPSYKIDRNCVWHQWRVGRVHVLAVLKMVRADLVRVVQLLCSFRAKITWPSVYDPFRGPVKGRCWSKNFFAHFSIHSFHFTFIMISIKNMEKKKWFFSRASFPWKWRPSLILGHSPRYI